MNPERCVVNVLLPAVILYFSLLLAPDFAPTISESGVYPWYTLSLIIAVPMLVANAVAALARLRKRDATRAPASAMILLACSLGLAMRIGIEIILSVIRGGLPPGSFVSEFDATAWPTAAPASSFVATSRPVKRCWETWCGT